MEKQFNIIKKRTYIKTGILFIIFILSLSFFLINFKQKQLLDAFKEPCIVTSIQELENCMTKTKYITIKTNKIYTTDYVYKTNKNTEALFIDIDIEGKSLIAVVEKEKAEQLLNQQNTIEITGKLELNNNTEMEKGKNNIINDYLNQIETDEQKELIKSNFLPGVLNEYEMNQDIIIVITSITILIIIFIFIIKNIILILYSLKRKSNISNKM